MSTILDALKKSERERKLNDLPTLSDMPPPQEASRLPVILLWVICALLGVLLLVVVAQWWTASKQFESAALLDESQQSSLDSSVATGVDLSGSSLVMPIEVVSYSAEPAQRFVIIAGNVVRENEFAQPGVLVEEIQRNAVVLNIRGQRVTRSP